MRAYRSLLRLARLETDARGRALAEATAAASAAQQCLAAHDAMLVQETRAADADAESLRAYGAFFRRARFEREGLERRRDRAESAVTQARELLAEAMAEQRKVERLIELEEERAEIRAAAREQAELDEAATLRYTARGKSKSG